MEDKNTLDCWGEPIPSSSTDETPSKNASGQAETSKDKPTLDAKEGALNQEQATTKMPVVGKKDDTTSCNALAVEPKDPQEVLAQVINTVSNDSTCMQREPELTAAVLMLAQALNNISNTQLSHDGTVDNDGTVDKTVDKTLPAPSEEVVEKKATPVKKRILSILFYVALTCLLTASILFVLAAIGFEPAMGVFGLNT